MVSRPIGNVEDRESMWTHFGRDATMQEAVALVRFELSIQLVEPRQRPPFSAVSIQRVGDDEKSTFVETREASR